MSSGKTQEQRNSGLAEGEKLNELSSGCQVYSFMICTSLIEFNRVEIHTFEDAVGMHTA